MLSMLACRHTFTQIRLYAQLRSRLHINMAARWNAYTCECAHAIITEGLQDTLKLNYAGDIK